MMNERNQDQTRRQSHTNSLKDSAPFSASHIPSLTTTIQNVLISVGTLFSSLFSLWVTFVVLLPFSCLKAITPRGLWKSLTSNNSGTRHAQSQSGSSAGRGRVVLVVDASNGLGFGLVAEHLKERDTTVLAATANIETLRNAIIDNTATQAPNATFQCIRLDLSGQRKQIAEVLKQADREYGPITHFYVVPPAGGLIQGFDNSLVKQNGSTVNDTSGCVNGYAIKESHGHAHGRQAVQTTGEFLTTHVHGMVTSILTVYEAMKGRGNGTIVVAIPVVDTTSWSSLFSASSNPQSTLHQITAFSTGTFLRTFATSLHFLAAQSSIDVVPIAFDLPLNDGRVGTKACNAGYKETDLRDLPQKLAAKVTARVEPLSINSTYYHDHAYIATLKLSSLSRQIVTQMARGVKFNPVVEGIVARSVNWYANLGAQPVSSGPTSRISETARNVEKHVKSDAEEYKDVSQARSGSEKGSDGR